LKVKIGGTYRLELRLPSLGHAAAADDDDNDNGDGDDDDLVYIDEICDGIGLGPLLRTMERIHMLDTQVVEQIGSLLGTGSLNELAHELPWYVAASVIPGPLLGDLYQRDRKRFELCSPRLVAFAEFMDALAEDDEPVNAPTRAARARRLMSEVGRAQCQRIVDDLNTRFLPSEQVTDDGRVIQPVLLEAIRAPKAKHLDVNVIRDRLGMVLECLGVERERVEINVIPAPLDPPPKPGGGGGDGGAGGGAAAWANTGDNPDTDGMEPTRVMGDPSGSDEPTRVMGDDDDDNDDDDGTETEPGTSKRHKGHKRR
jgi:hypothetical protein